jgi:hypothetical protein
MSLTLPAGAPDNFALSTAGAPPTGISSVAAAPSTLGSIISTVLRDDVSIKKQMTPAEYEAVQVVLKNVGTPDEYSSAMEYVLRALPYVRSTYAAMDVIQPLLPTNLEISILMKDRFLSN